MLFEIVIFIFYTIFCLFSIIGYGIIFNKFIFNPVEKNLGDTALLGFLLLFFISILLHFFIPLFYWLNFFLLLLGFIISCINFRNINIQISEVKKNLFFITLIILTCIFMLNKHADYDWYHLPYVNYLNNFKVVFGLVNISNNYTYGHGWMDIMGLFSLPIIETKGLGIISLIFYYFFFLYLLIEIKTTKLKSVMIYSIILIVYSFANFNKLADFEAEIQPTLILFLIILNVLKMINYKDTTELFAKIILYFFFTLVLRIGSIIFIPFILVITFINLKNLPKYFFNYLRLNCFLTLFFSLFIIKNFILTGCLSYPIYWTCISNDQISWANPIENAKERYEYLSASSKRWKFYTIEKGELKSHYEYFEPMEKGIILDPKSYNEDKLFWLKYWSRDHDIARLLNSILMIIFCFICFSFVANNKIEVLQSYKFTIKKNNLIHFGFLFSILMWFFLSPQMRYGGHPAIGGTLMYYSALIIPKYNISQKKFNIIVILLLLITTSYFISKNIIRVSKTITKNEFSNFPWPEYKSMIFNKDYKEVTINGIKLNLILTSENMIKGEPVMCGNVDMLCLPHERIVCISEINNKNGYVFIKNDNPECLTQFKQNYWQH